MGRRGPRAGLVAMALALAACGSPPPPSRTATASETPAAAAATPGAPATSSPASAQPAPTPAASASPGREVVAFLSPGPDPAFAGDTVAFTVGEVYWTNGTSSYGGPLKVAAATVDFGDGSSTVASGGCSASAAVRHAYRAGGSFTAAVTRLSLCDGGPAALGEAATAQVEVFAAAPAGSASWPACSAARLRLTGRSLGAAAGSAAALVVLTNPGPSGCRIDGIPRVVLRSPGGGLLRTDERAGAFMLFPELAPHAVALAPGGSASFDVGWADNPFGPDASKAYVDACPPAAGLSVALRPAPDTGGQLPALWGFARLALAPCEGAVWVSSVVPGPGGLTGQ